MDFTLPFVDGGIVGQPEEDGIGMTVAVVGKELPPRVGVVKFSGWNHLGKNQYMKVS